MIARKSKAQEAEGTWDNEVGDTTKVDVETNLETFRSARSIYSQLPNYQDLHSIKFRIRRFYFIDNKLKDLGATENLKPPKYKLIYFPLHQSA